MGQGKNTTKAGWGAQRDTSSTLSSHGGKPEDTTHDQLEEVSLQMGASSKTHFRFMQLSRQPSVHSLSPEGRWACLMTPDNGMHYCLHVRVILGEGEAANLHLPTHGVDYKLLTCSRDGLKEWITKAVVLALREAILFFGRQLHKWGLPYMSARDIGFSFTGPVKLGQENSTTGSDCKCCARRLSSYCRSCHEEDKVWGGQGIPKGWGKPSCPQLVPVM